MTHDGRIILSQHQWYEPKYRVVELRPDGAVEPFPSEQWASEPAPGSKTGITAVVGVRIRTASSGC